MRVYEIRTIDLPPQEVEDEGICWMTLYQKGLGSKKSVIQQMPCLVVVALKPTVRPPKALRRVNVADILAITDLAITETPTDPLPALPSGKRPPLRPVTASRNWLPPDEAFRSGNWKAGRSQPVATARVRRLSRACGLEVPGKALVLTQDSTVWSGGSTAGVLFSVMIERFKLGTKDEDFAERFHEWRELLDGIPLGPEVLKVLHGRVDRRPWRDAVEIQAAAERDARNAERRAAEEESERRIAEEFGGVTFVTDSPPWTTEAVRRLVDDGRRQIRSLATDADLTRGKRAAAMRRVRDEVLARVRDVVLASPSLTTDMLLPETMVRVGAELHHRDMDIRRRRFTRYEPERPKLDLSMRLYMSH